MRNSEWWSSEERLKHVMAQNNECESCWGTQTVEWAFIGRWNACAFKQEHILVKNQVKLRNCTLEPDAQWNWKFKKGFAFFSPRWRLEEKLGFGFVKEIFPIVFQRAISVSLEEQLCACRAGCSGHIFNYTSPSLGDNCSGLIRIKTYSTTLKNALMLTFLNPSLILGNTSTAISACKQKGKTLLLHADMSTFGV